VNCATSCSRRSLNSLSAQPGQSKVIVTGWGAGFLQLPNPVKTETMHRKVHVRWLRGGEGRTGARNHRGLIAERQRQHIMAEPPGTEPRRNSTTARPTEASRVARACFRDQDFTFKSRLFP
jgi:hypothetical protein